MKIIRNIFLMQKMCQRYRREGRTIGFVPTMGYLHQGHSSLLRASRTKNDISVLSIFVNPKQFGPHEDFRRYPRDIKKDEMLAKKENVDIIFHPTESQMYPSGYSTCVTVSRLSEKLCGAFRPGHFEGVTTVVNKLLAIVTPNILYLGQKDAQQAVIIKRMVQDLNLSVHIQILPTVRESDGLAMSSRNIYLSPVERRASTVLFRALEQARTLITQKRIRRSQPVITAMTRMIQDEYPVKIDYIACVDAQTLNPLRRLKGKVLIALAVWFSKTRLIDNVMLNIP